ncbi:hypothetical protein [Streptomyces sp. NPDC047985]|uniref:hypothetical protein n=1 Tax=unclassified Streptomyces TaxID=2593676 RepID=UPI003433599C
MGGELHQDRLGSLPRRNDSRTLVSLDFCWAEISENAACTSPPNCPPTSEANETRSVGSNGFISPTRW